ncbi:MAG: hypothetical protein Q8K58_06065 [Acidimicrobiales bacterium]|nr:hypothetical protein [Acidimicrobiales bacterium]
MLDLSTAVLCDFAQVRDRLLFCSSGAVSRLYRQELPSPLGLMVGLVIEVPLEDAGMEHTLRAEVINRHGTVLAELQNLFRVSDEGLFPHEVQQVPLVLSITGVRARTWGTHQVRLYLDDELVRALTLYVVPAAGTQAIRPVATQSQPEDAAAEGSLGGTGTEGLEEEAAISPDDEAPGAEAATAAGEDAPAAPAGEAPGAATDDGSAAEADEAGTEPDPAQATGLADELLLDEPEPSVGPADLPAAGAHDEAPEEEIEPLPWAPQDVSVQDAELDPSGDVLPAEDEETGARTRAFSFLSHPGDAPDNAGEVASDEGPDPDVLPAPPPPRAAGRSRFPFRYRYEDDESSS